MLSIQTLRNYLTQDIWQPSLATRTTPKAHVARLLRWFYVLVREIAEAGLDYRAMGLVYTTLLSLAPLLAFVFSVLKAFGFHNQLEPLLLRLFEPLGDKSVELVANIIGFVGNIRVGVLGTVGLAVLLYSVIVLLEKTEDSFNQIWRTSESRSWIRRFSDYLSILLIGPLLVFFAFGVTASMTNSAVAQKLIAMEPFGTAYYLFGLVVPYLLIISAFTFVYAFMPNTQVKLTSALAGGTAAGLAWKFVGWAFGVFVSQSANYSAIYSGFAVVILFMIWLYLSWLILLLGGVISFYHQHPRYLHYKSRHPQLSPRQLQYLGFLLMSMIAKAHHQGRDPWTLAALTDAVAMPWEPVFRTLQRLQQAHLLVTLHTEPEAYLPARSLDTIPLQAIYDALWTSEENGAFDCTAEGVEQVLILTESLEAAASGVLDNRTLHDLL